jgi:small redox-active disulfide protein 2
MKIQILGTGCPKCKKLTENVEAALKEAGVTAEVEKVTAVADIAKFNVMFTPALAIDGVVKVAGKVPDVKKIVEILKSAQS